MSLHALVEKWRGEAEDLRVSHSGPGIIARTTALDECADELEAALAAGDGAVAWIDSLELQDLQNGKQKAVVFCASHDGDDVPLYLHPTGAVQVTDDALNTEYTRGRCDGFDAACNPITYKNQPDNVGAWRLGEACRNAKPGGDLIDHGLSLLKELQEKGYGVVALNPGGSRE